MCNTTREYIPLWQLALLVRFMFDASPVELFFQNMAISENHPSISQFDALIEAIWFARDSLTSEKFFSAKKWSELYFEITATRNREKLGTYLKEYAKAYEEDELIDYAPKIEHLSYANQLRQFKQSIKKELNLKSYHITSVDFLPVILVGFFKKDIIIKDYSLTFPTPEESDNVPVLKELVDDGKVYGITLYDDFWNIRMIINVEKLFKKKAKSTQTGFSKEEIFVITHINKLKEEGKNFISINKLEQLFTKSIKNNKAKTSSEVISHAVSALNTKNKAINSIPLLGHKQIETQQHEAGYPIL